jgi:virulence-associated protein VapD
MKKEQGLDSKKVVNFDLDTNALKTAIQKGEIKFKSYTSAYGKIRRFLVKSGFEHDQGSAYVSKEVMSLFDTQTVFFKLGQKNPWLVSCMSKCRLSSFEDGALTYTDLKPDIEKGVKSQGSGLAASPAGYGAVKDVRDKAKADALRETLKTSPRT